MTRLLVIMVTAIALTSCRKDLEEHACKTETSVIERRANEVKIMLRRTVGRCSTGSAPGACAIELLCKKMECVFTGDTLLWARDSLYHTCERQDCLSLTSNLPCVVVG